MPANNINTFRCNQEEKWIYAGTKSCELLQIDVETFAVHARYQAHNGSIENIAVHRELPYVAAFGKDRKISLWKTLANGSLEFLYFVPLRAIAAGDGMDLYKSTSQALAFHPVLPRLAGHTGDCALFEARFDDKGYEVLSCHRPHGNFDFVTIQYLEEGTALLTGSVRGEAALSLDGKVVRTWDFGTGNNFQVLHWFESLGGGVYIAASDAQKAVRFHVEDKEPTLQGEIFAKDHVEHVTYNRHRDRAYCSSFDRNVYEIDPVTCNSTRIAWKAPFKLRWISCLDTQPDILIVQCRDGALTKVDLNTGKKLAEIKDTPDAQWSIAAVHGRLLVAGEGAKVAFYAPGEVEGFSRIQRFKESSLALDGAGDGYTKRVVARGTQDLALLARTDGEVWIIENGASRKLVTLHTALRDIVLFEKTPRAIAAGEDGRVYALDLRTGSAEVIFTSDLPVWALALNEPAGKLAMGIRVGTVLLMSLDTLQVQAIATGTRFCKRLRWFDNDCLLIGSSETLLRYRLSTQTLDTLVKNLPNTIEDFHWNRTKEYLVLVNYTRDLFLCDAVTGKVLDTHSDSLDYTKGILCLDCSVSHTGYDADFIGVGRQGTPKYFRVHDDRIFTWGNLG